MKLGKLVLPILVIAVAAIIYLLYLAPKHEAGDFSKFDTNSKTNYEIKLTLYNQGGQMYAKDGKGTTVPFACDGEIPPEAINNNSLVTVIGHLHEDHFHAVEVKMP